MLKQHESLHQLTGPRQSLAICYLIFLTAFSLSTELNAQYNSPSGEKTEETTPPGLTPLDLIVDGPYTQETKHALLEEQIVTRALKFFPLHNYKIVTVIPSASTLGPKLPENPEVGYHEFVARRTATDQERIIHKDTLITLGKSLGYTATSFYLTYQDLSYYVQDWGSGTICVIDVNFFRKMITWQAMYNINPKQGVQGYIEKRKYPTGKPSVQPHPNNKPDPLRVPEPEEMFRTHPGVEVTTYGQKTLQVYRYDRATAAQLLKELGCRFWSTNLQDDEIGQQYTSGYTSVEGISQDCIDGITTLITTLKNKGIDKPNLCINGATEGYDHRMGNNIIAGKTKLGTMLAEKHAKAHGSGFTIDIRLTGPEAIELKKIFPGTRGTIQIGSTMYMYYFHGKGKNHHLHLSIFSKKHYELLYGAIKK